MRPVHEAGAERREGEKRILNKPMLLKDIGDLLLRQWHGGALVQEVLHVHGPRLSMTLRSVSHVVVPDAARNRDEKTTLLADGDRPRGN